jgi:RimJ/RimL family protein N-acetyltransferase
MEEFYQTYRWLNASLIRKIHTAPTMTESSPPIIETPRLRLRRMEEPPGEEQEVSVDWARDRAFFVAVRTDPNTIRWHMDGVPDQTLQETEAWMRRQAGRPWGNYLAELRSDSLRAATTDQSPVAKDVVQLGSDGELVTVAGVGIVRPGEKAPPAAGERAKSYGPELGYVVHPSHRGHGYATEAVRGLITAFLAHEAAAERTGDLRYDYVEAETDSDNEPSQNVLRKCGFRVVRTIERDNYSYALGGWRDAIVWRLNPPEDGAERPEE